MSFSNSGGGTLTLPSPTHVHHVDVSAAVRSLRRSMSRSPSKFSLVRTASQSSDTSSSASRYSPSPSSPSCRRVLAQPQQASALAVSTTPEGTPHRQLQLPPQTPLATPFRPSVKLSLRSAKSSAKAAASSTKAISRTRTSPKSPLKRALNVTSDSGNSTPASSAGSDASGQENLSAARTRSPITRKSSEKLANRHSMHLDISGASQQALSRLIESSHNSPASTASPLKRSDATMDLDQPSLGSPKAKRRSYGPSSFSQDFNVFDHGPTTPSFEIHDDSNREYDWTSGVNNSSNETVSTPTPSPFVMPRRAGSLRKSTLQQRHGPERTSWGRRHGAQQLQQLSNDVSTPAKSNRARLSLDHFMPPQVARESPFTAGALPNASVHLMNQAVPRVHPLSRTMTTSSSNSSVPDESPTHFPVVSEKPRAPLNFSKSLPIGATRPQADDSSTLNAGVSTPEYKSAKPWIHAFMSTGLVSKVNRNPEQEPFSKGGASAMPDTPCKRQLGSFATYPPPPPPGSAKSRSRYMRPSFGAPSTPFNPVSGQNQYTFGEQPKPIGISNLFSSRHTRKGSLLSLYSDDGKSPIEFLGELQKGLEGELPPTPTKQQLLNENSTDIVSANDSPSAQRTMPPPTSAIGHRRSHQETAVSSSPLERIEFMDRSSPRTPQETMMPPDASRLTISNPADSRLFPPTSSAKSSFPPATPTTRQDGFPLIQDRRAITPINGFSSHDVDDALMSRFSKVELTGTGEFSQVYRVVEPAPTFRGFFTPTHHAPTTASHGRVFAVKKARLPFKGTVDRELRFREVAALRALQGAEHVLQLHDSWEEKNHLYIQTEYCEEGSLDVFLSVVGHKGRLDDFRIWKILLELGQGLKCIHDAGFVHLDLKPANILINFEGTLKIGDFGMAAQLPVDKATEFEGDREYLALEILRGDIDKPADIFALGLIMLEIAANVKLPDNGPSWVALRSGDFSEVPALTRDDTISILRDATGMPVDETERSVNSLQAENSLEFGSPSKGTRRHYSLRNANRQSGNIFGLSRKTELQEPPQFMREAECAVSLDSVVKWMLSAETIYRPTITQLLELESLNWVASRRRASATVFEGNWGPADEPISLDTEMMDV